MTTIQPRLMRADTLDLQSHDSPSAKDHSRSPTFSSYTHANSGAHHREALRSAEESAYNDQMSSPRGAVGPGHNGLGGQTHLYDSADEEDGEDENHDQINGNVQQDGEYENGEIEDEDDLDDDMLDKISSSPSIEDEDIDFEFVYALHTFVATVEGQANATKGDTMVLLDDSNSYWWLVRVVKDGSIGYLPAEHIETPTERLARLNKHRNIDLAASMLGDNPEKSKNPLKKAMRRRNAKSVAFAAPTYYEPSDYAYSSDEDGEDEEQEAELNDLGQQSTDTVTEEVIIADDTQESTANGARNVGVENKTAMEPQPLAEIDNMETGPQSPQDENFQRTRNGVVRNTDSFFKDDTAETKKISLTPRLLRGDSEESSANISQTTTNTTDTFDKMLGDDKGKDEKKKKEKKGMLSGFFKRKDKKAGKNDTDDIQSPEESLASPTSKESMESQMSMERKTSKLQKQPPGAAQAKQSPTEAKISSHNSSLVNSPTTASGPISSQAPTIQAIEPQPALVTQELLPESKEQSPAQAEPHTEKRSIFAPITTVLKPSSSATDVDQPVKAVYSKRAKERFAIDTSDSDEESTTTSMQVPAPTRHSISPMLDTELQKSRPDSAMQVSPIDSSDEQHEQMFSRSRKAAAPDDEATTPTDTQGHSDTASTSKPSPSLATHTPSTSRSTPTWSDASLRSYMDNDQDIRDLLIIIHDKSNVTPVGPDHPLMGGLFSNERSRLTEMQSQLDSMLTNWISKKNPGLLAK